MKALFLDTVREMISRKIIILFAVIVVILLLIVWGSWEVREGLAPQSDLSAGDDVGRMFEPWVAEAFSRVLSVFVFFAVLASAGLLPGALEKGRAEFLLSKPLSRTELLLGKLLSVWLAYGTLVLSSSLIVYGVTCAVHGFFDPRIFLLFAVYAVDFLVWLSVVGLAGVISGSAAWAVMSAFGLWVAQWLLSFHEAIKQFSGNRIISYVMEGLYYLLPKTDQLGDVGVSLAIGRPVESWLPVWSSVLFAFVLTYFALLVFHRRDY